MGSSPILAQGAPGSSVGRARTQRQMHLVYMAGWCNGSTPGSLPGDSVRVRACNHMARSSNGRTLGSLPGYEDSTSSCATKGCSRPQNTRTPREDGFLPLNYHRLYELLVCGLSFVCGI